MKKFLFTSVVAIVFLNIFFPSLTFAQARCGGVDTAIIDCTGTAREGGNQAIGDSAIWWILLMVINILTGLVAVAAVGGIVYGAIMYASAQDNSSQVQEAIGIIRNVIIGIVLYVAMFALLQYLIPGGVFSSAGTP